MTIYAFVNGGTVDAVGRLPKSARRLDTGEWVMGLATAPTELVEACGWFPVVDSPPTFDEATEVLERGGVELVNGTPTVVYTVRAKTAEEIAAADAEAAALLERRQVKAALTQLTAYLGLASPTAAQTRDAVILLAKIVRRMVRDQYGDPVAGEPDPGPLSLRV